VGAWPPGREVQGEHAGAAQASGIAFETNNATPLAGAQDVDGDGKRGPWRHRLTSTRSRHAKEAPMTRTLTAASPTL
jgi:hypothetical protein